MDARVKVRIAPLSAALGAEVTGVDWTQTLDTAVLDDVKAAFLE